MRDINKVIDAIINEVPAEFSDEIKTFEKIKSNDAYLAPEQKVNSFIALCDVLNKSKAFNPIDKNWQKRVQAIISNEVKV